MFYAPFGGNKREECKGRDRRGSFMEDHLAIDFVPCVQRAVLQKLLKLVVNKVVVAFAWVREYCKQRVGSCSLGISERP